jgi:hypothetical protein
LKASRDELIVPGDEHHREMRQRFVKLLLELEPVEAWSMNGVVKKFAR